MKAFLGGMLAGIIFGALLTVMASRVIESRQDPWPDAVMTVMSHEFKAVRAASKIGECTSPASAKSLQQMSLLALDVEPALMPTPNDRVFTQYATDLRSAIGKASAAASDCKQFAASVSEIGEACDACHRDYKSR